MPTNKTDRRRYLKIDADLYQSAAFRTLPASALKLWVDLRTQFNGANNGNISATMSVLVHRGWVSTSTLQNALRELLARGLIDHTRRGKPGPFRICSLYRFTDLPTAKNEARFIEGRVATYEYANWQPDGEVKKIRASEIEATPLRKPKCYRFGNRSVEALSASEIEAQKNGEIAPETAPVLASSEIGATDRQRFGNRTTLYIPGGVGIDRGGVDVAVDPEVDRDVEVDSESVPEAKNRRDLENKTTPALLGPERIRSYEQWKRKQERKAAAQRKASQSAPISESRLQVGN